MNFKLFLLLAFLSGLIGCGTSPPPSPGEQLTNPCRLANNVEAQCGIVSVFENRTAASGRMIDIHFAVIAARSSIVEPDPIFLLAGGPGQSALETFPLIINALSDLNQDRDIVLVDQRGTGQSQPLNCPAVRDLAPDSTEEMMLVELASCRTSLSQTADLSRYTTDIAMADLDQVREALGYETINLIGTSYGTRAALTYLNLFPDRTRSLVLNAVTSPQLILQLQAPRDGERALQALFERCSTDAACRETFPDLENRFNTLRERLSTEQRVSIFHPLTGEPLDFMLDQEMFMGAIFNLLYSAELVSLLPLLIDQAYSSNDFAPLMGQTLALVEGVNLYTGMFYSVTCTEDASLIDLGQAETVHAGSRFPLSAEHFVDACNLWLNGTLVETPSVVRRPVESLVPTLLLSGAADPITPPLYAREVAAGLPNSLHLVLPGYGHDVLLVGCMPGVAAEFISQAAVADLETGCVDEIVPPPFFVSPTGPRP